VGRKKQPTYRIVVAESTAARDGQFIEILGQYAPRTSEVALNLREDRVEYWLDKGALPTDTVRSLLRRTGLLRRRHEVRVGSKRAAAAIPVKEAKAEE
jgi:small subunit ribosomal protein S16